MIRELPTDLAKVAKEELNEKPAQTKNDVQHLKDWISKQPHLRARTDDQWLVAMLRGCKFSLERVKKTGFVLHPEDDSTRHHIEDQTNRSQVYGIFKLGTCIALPKPKDQLFPRVILIRAGAFDPNVYSVADLMCTLYYLVQILMIEDDVASVLGTKIMVDYEGVTMSHFVMATPTMLKKMIAVCQDSMPLRLKGSHHVNLPSGVEKIFTLISGLLNEKAKQRLKIHKTSEELSEHIPKEIIPKEYGGTGDTVAKIIEYWASKFTEYKSWMQQEELLGTDESKRPGQPINPEAMGMEGSFRQLQID